MDSTVSLNKVVNSPKEIWILVNIRNDSSGNPSFDKSLTPERTRQHDNVDGELSTFASYFPQRVFQPANDKRGLFRY